MERKLVEVAYEITHQCNLRCTHCYNSNWVRNPRGEMSTGQAQSALRRLREFGAEKLKIGGGEPLMRKDFFTIFGYASSLGFDANFSTNGLLIPKFIGKIQKCNISKIQLSLDNIGQKHDLFRNRTGLFETLEESAKLLSDAGIKINIATTLTSENFRDLGSILSFCKANSARGWKIMAYIPKGPSDPLLLSPSEYKDAVGLLLDWKRECNDCPEIIVAREFDLIQEPLDYNDMQCFGGKSFLSLKPNGDVTPCSYLNDLVVGNILDMGVEELWNDSKMVSFAQGPFNPSCPHAHKCRGGCKARAYFMGSKGCDPYCWASPKGGACTSLER